MELLAGGSPNAGSSMLLEGLSRQLGSVFALCFSRNCVTLDHQW